MIPQERDRVQGPARTLIWSAACQAQGLDAIFQGASDFDLELIESRMLDGNIQELTYRPSLHV
jgi:hypothetical protein